jgi:hypothetical protein
MAADKKLIEEVASVRTQLRANPRAKLEVLAAISKSLRDNGIDISSEALRDLQITTSGEIGTLHEVVLPVGTPCGV